MDCNITVSISLHFVQFWWHSVQKPQSLRCWQYHLLRRYGKNWHIKSNISEYPRPILTYFTRLVGVLVGMIIPILIWQSLKGCCHGNQLNLGDVRRWRQKRPLLVTLAFDNFHLLACSPPKLQTNLHQNFTRYSGISGAIKSCIYKALVHSVSERQSNEWSGRFWRCQNAPKSIGYYSNVPWEIKKLNEVNKLLHPSIDPVILVKIGPLTSELLSLES